MPAVCVCSVGRPANSLPQERAPKIESDEVDQPIVRFVGQKFDCQGQAVFTGVGQYPYLRQCGQQLHILVSHAVSGYSLPNITAFN